MTSNELADKLDLIRIELTIQASAMLRQQQAEIEALKEKLKIAEQLERTIDIANYLKKASEK